MASLFRTVLLALAASQIAVPASADFAKFKLINTSGYTLVRFYASPANQENWGRDIFGDATLESGFSSFITVPGNTTQCVFDFRMIFSDEDVLYDTVNLCEVGQYTIN